MNSFTFPKKFRLLTPICFDFVFQKPKQIKLSEITILGRLNLFLYPRLGLIVSKKNIKFAHERNRIKRLIRESFRLNQHRLPPMDFVVITKTGIVDLNNHVVLNTLESLWKHYHRFVYKY